MNEPNKGIQLKEEATQNSEGASAASPSFSWKRLMAKKWAYPAMYMVAAAIILSLMWVYQDVGKQKVADDTIVDLTKPGLDDSAAPTDPDAMPVAATPETMQWPVQERSEFEVVLEFFDPEGSNEMKQAAMLEYDNSFTPHVGLDLARHDEQAFDVMAALSGEVTLVEKNHPIVGNLVEITHSNGLITVYQSLGEITVAQGAEVSQGDVIAKAGRNELEKDLGVHLHFEVRQGQDGPTVNPTQLIPELEN